MEAEESQSVGAELEAMRQVLVSLERLMLEVSGRVTALVSRMTEDRETKREQKSPHEEDRLKEGECVRVCAKRSILWADRKGDWKTREAVLGRAVR